MRCERLLQILGNQRRRTERAIDGLEEVTNERQRLRAGQMMGDYQRRQFLALPALREGGHHRELEQWRETSPGTSGELAE